MRDHDRLRWFPRHWGAEAVLPLIILVATAAPLLAEGMGAPQIRVDQFGYPPGAPKVAVLRNAVLGYDAPGSYVPGVEIQIRRSADGTIAMAGPPQAWNGGALHDQSGDEVWWFDFSGLDENGSFYVHDPDAELSSEDFTIGTDVYAEVLTQASRMYYYQRCGTAKQPPYAEPDWADQIPCHLGEGQDLDCRLITNPIPETSRDLSGGWHDAGDHNKYVNYTNAAIHRLLDAFEAAPLIWGDEAGIPESGNDVPDLLDEIRWELEWLLKMQDADGSVFHKVSVTEWQSASPPSADAAHRYYAPATTSATISACGMFAHGAHVFRSLADPPSQEFVDFLEAAALAAWAWLEANPGYSDYDNAGFLSAAAEHDHYTQEMNRLRAAAHLLRLTGEVPYRNWIDDHYLNSHLLQWTWVSPWEEIAQSGLLLYATLPEATPGVATAIFATWETAIHALLTGDVLAQVDAYRASLQDGDHSWGSNSTKCLNGHMFAITADLEIDPINDEHYRNAAADYVHYIHGVNPTGYCFLTHMDDYGSEHSVREMYHAWFGDGTVWDNADSSQYGPAPGYLTGGVNPTYHPDPEYTGPPIEPPENQPIQKSYLDWNTGWPENSWEVTECHIPYQAAYLRLLAEVAGAQSSDVEDGAGEMSSRTLRLSSAFSNPFSSRTMLRFTLPGPGHTRLGIHDAEGRRVAELLDASLPAGPHTVLWTGESHTGRPMPSGTYLARLAWGGHDAAVTIVLLR